MTTDEFDPETMIDENYQKRNSPTKQVIETVASWPGITTGEGRFNATTFQIENRDVGHVHPWGPVDIGYPQRLQEQLIADGETGEHHIVGDRATTFHVKAADDVEQAVALLRLSYLYQVVVLQKRGDVDSDLSAINVSDELASMDLSDALRAIFEDIRSR